MITHNPHQFDLIQQSLSDQMRAWEHAMKRQKTLHQGLIGLQVGILISLMIGLIGHFTLGLTQSQFIVLTVSISLGCIGLALSRLWLTRPPVQQIAQQFDTTFAFQERASTALELLTGAIQAEPTLHARQIQDTYHQIQSINIHQRIVPPPNRYDWARLSALVMLLLGAIILFPTPSVSIPSAPSQSETVIIQGVDQLEETLKMLALDATLEDTDRQALFDELSAILDTLNHEAISVDEALALINEAQELLQSQASEMQTAINQQNQALDTALEALQNADEPFASLEEALAQIAMQPEPINAEQLAQAAQALNEHAPELAQQIAQIAEQLEQPDPVTPREQFEQALEELQALERAQQRQQDSADQLEELAQQLEQEQPDQQGDSTQSDGLESVDDDEREGEQPQSGEEGDSPAEQDQEEGAESTGEQPQSGENPSDDPASDSQPDQQGESGSDSNQDGETLTQQTNANNPNPDENFLSQAETSAATQDTINVPSSIIDENVSEIRLGSDDTHTQQGDFTDNPTGTITVPYQDVFNTYLNNATSALEQTYIPIGLRDVIRNYFTAIHPSSND